MWAVAEPSGIEAADPGYGCVSQPTYLAGTCVRFEVGRKHTRESGEIVCNLKHAGAPKIVVPTNASETRPETRGALPIRILKTAVSGIVMAFCRDAFETGLVRYGPLFIVSGYLWVRTERPL